MQPSRDDVLYGHKLWLLRLLTGAPAPIDWPRLPLAAAAAAARTLCLREPELALLSSSADLHRPISPRNEAAALALLVSNEQEVAGGSAERRVELHQLAAAYEDRGGEAERIGGFDSDSPEQRLLRWAAAEGASSQLAPALFRVRGTPGMRGCAAAEDLPAGAVAASVPCSLLLTYQTAAESSLGRALSRLPGMDEEALAVAWTMVDRHDDESPWAPFWASLPGSFGTGLSAPRPLVDLLAGSPAHGEFSRARAHVKQQFERMGPVFETLLAAYGKHLRPSWFEEGAYLWAIELWYSYAIQVKFPDGSVRPALGPLVSLANHSPWPHIVHFSTVDPKDRRLRLATFRPMPKGAQATLSYGPLPNSQLLLFYGFAVDGNPFEEAPLDVPPPEGEAGAAAAALLAELRLGLRHVLTAQRPLPPGLMPCLRAVCATPEELAALQRALQQRWQQEEQQQQQSQATAPAAAGNQGGTAGGSRRPQGGKGGGAKAAGSRMKASSSAAAAAAAAAATSAAAEQLQAAWAAADTWSALLGAPLSEQTEAAALAMLRRLLDAGKAPWEACLGRIARRRQLQAALAAQGHSGGAGAPEAGEGFVAAVATLARGMAGLYEACGEQARCYG